MTEALLERVRQVAEAYDLYEEPEVLLAAICDELGIKKGCECFGECDDLCPNCKNSLAAIRTLLDGADR